MWSIRLAVIVVAIGYATTAAATPAPDGEQQNAPVVALRLDIRGDVPARARDILEQRFQLGLKACELHVLTRKDADRGPTSADCTSASCRRSLASRVQAQYIAGGSVAVTFDNYELNLWLADGYSGKTVAEVARRCDVCGIQAVAETLDLAASALRAKLETTRSRPARITIVTHPPGAELTVDGDPVGNAPQTLDLPAGTHQIGARSASYISAQRQLTAVSGVAERIELQLLPEPPPTSSWRPIVGWSALGLGVAVVATGAVLVAIDGNAADCTPSQGGVVGELCSSQRDTSIGGMVALGVGAAMAGSGLYLLLTGHTPTKTQHPVGVSLIPSPNGGKLAVQASF